METTANSGNTIFSLKECQKTVKSLTTEFHKHRFESSSVFRLWIQPFCPPLVPPLPRQFTSRVLIRMSSAKSQVEQHRRRGFNPRRRLMGAQPAHYKTVLHIQQTESSAWQKGNIIRIKKKEEERKEGFRYRGVGRIHKASRHKQDAQKQGRKSEADYCSLL